MARRTPLAVEGLEERALLSALAFSLTTNQSEYEVGQPIEIRFTEANTSDQPVTVAVSPTDFLVSENNYVIWQSDPTNAGQPATSETLSPGQSVSQTASWDGTEADADSYSIAGSQINVFGNFVASNPNAPAGMNATFQIANPLASTVTTDQSVYQFGQPVQMTDTEVNHSDQSITIPQPEPAGFSITHNGTPILEFVEPPSPTGGTETIAPGQVMTTTQTWDGIPESYFLAPGDLTGTFVASYGPNVSNEVTATFQIEAPSPTELATSVTTDQTTYQLGQSVNMTFTETDIGDQPVAVVTGETGFQISQNGTANLGSILNPYSLPLEEPTWMTLQPGQSYSQTETWDGLPRSLVGPLISLSAPFTIANDFDPNPDTAAFQYTAPPTSALQTSVTTDQSTYQLGQPIQITFSETNVGATPIPVWEGPTSFDIAQNGTEVWNSLFPDVIPYVWSLGNYSWGTLQPGQSYTQTTTWNGVPDQLPSADLSGTFTVSNELDPHAGSATFGLAAPPANALISTITTDKAVYYNLGSPIQVTFTETNISDQPVVVLTGSEAFKVASDGSLLWEFTAIPDLLSSASWETLQPGQSYSQTFTNGGGAPGTWTVTNLLDPNGSSAIIQIVVNPYETQTSPPPSQNTPPVSPPSNPTPSTMSSQRNSWTNFGPIAVKLSVAPIRKLGHAIRFSLILKKTNAGKLAINESRHTETVTVQHGSTVVYELAQKAHPLTARMIRSGRPLIFRTLWSGKPNQAGVKKLSSGLYSVTVDHDGFTASITVDLVLRRKERRSLGR